MASTLELAVPDFGLIVGTRAVLAAGVALLVALLTGVASGFFPAWRAARMNPVDALRHEYSSNQ